LRQLNCTSTKAIGISTSWRSSKHLELSTQLYTSAGFQGLQVRPCWSWLMPPNVWRQKACIISTVLVCAAYLRRTWTLILGYLPTCTKALKCISLRGLVVRSPAHVRYWIQPCWVTPSPDSQPKRCRSDLVSRSFVHPTFWSCTFQPGQCILVGNAALSTIILTTNFTRHTFPTDQLRPCCCALCFLILSTASRPGRQRFQ
jgi:hypothetical protein